MHLIPADFALIAVLVVAAVLVIVHKAASSAEERKRQEAYKQFAANHGLSYDADGSPLALILGRGFPIFQIGHSHHWRHVLRGIRSGVSFSAFEFEYQSTGGTNSQITYRLAMMSWERPEKEWPQFVLGPEDWWDRVKERFGAQDVDFPEDEPFSRAFVLQGEDEAKVRALFDGAKRAYLTALPHSHAAGAGAHLLWWHMYPLPGLDRLDDFLTVGDDFRRVLYA